MMGFYYIFQPHMMPFHQGAQGAQGPHRNSHFPGASSAEVRGRCLCPEMKGNGDLLRAEKIRHTIVLVSINLFLLTDFNVKRNRVYNIDCNKSQCASLYSSPSGFTLSLTYWLILLFLSGRSLRWATCCSFVFQENKK